MNIPQADKKHHPQYREYLEFFEASITGLESGARGSGAPENIIASSLRKALLFHDADSVALVETDTELGYGVCVSELCRDGVKSFEGRIINISPTDTPCLYKNLMNLTIFDVVDGESDIPLSQTEQRIVKHMDAQILVIAPFYKRHSGFIYLRNPKRYIGLYGILQAVSYICATERNEFRLMDDLNIAVGSKQIRSDKDVKIKVFGGLSITTKFGTLTESEITSPQCVRLVAYLLLNDTRKVSQRELTDALWPNQEVNGPAKQVKNIVHRTRTILNPIFPDDLVSSDRSGNYFINPNINITTDASVFESLYRKGMLPATKPKEKIVYLLRATQLYQDDFLPNYVGDTWLDNQRTYYHLSYLQAVLTLLPLLYQEQDYSKMYSVSSEALLYEPENGDIHFWHIRAMVNLGGYEIAQKHFTQHLQTMSEEQKDFLTGLFFTHH